MTLADLPALNAGLNVTSAALLLVGLWSIRAKRLGAHIALMFGACVVSAAFLASYLTYHAHVGSVRFLGTGPIRPIYFTLLISHSILAVVIVPLILRALFLAARKRYAEHVAIARWTWPLWLYVSVTGVVVYWLLYHAEVAHACPGCKEALIEPGALPQRLSTARGYAWSIGLLLSVPFVLVGGTTALIMRAARRRGKHASAPRRVLTP